MSSCSVFLLSLLSRYLRALCPRVVLFLFPTLLLFSDCFHVSSSFCSPGRALVRVMVSSWRSPLFACLLAALLLSSRRHKPVSARCPPLVLLASPLLVVSFKLWRRTLVLTLVLQASLRPLSCSCPLAPLPLFASPRPTLFPFVALLVLWLPSWCLPVSFVVFLVSSCPLVAVLFLLCLSVSVLAPLLLRCCCASVALLAQACLLSARAPTVNCFEKTPGSKAHQLQFQCENNVCEHGLNKRQDRTRTIYATLHRR